MNRLNKYVVTTFFLIGTTSIMASEAYNPIAYGTKSMGMGGVSIATLHGAESGFENPALLYYLPRNEFSVGMAYTMPDRSLRDTNTTLHPTKQDDTYAPYMALAYKINNNFTLGLTASKEKMQNYVVDILGSNIRKTRAIIPISYGIDNFSFGVSLVAEREEYDLYVPDSATETYGSTDYGYMAALAYKIPQSGILVALNYKSKIDHKFFRVDHHFNLNSASEIGIGLHWDILDSGSSIGVDYKRIDSSELYSSETNADASSYYKDNQNVFAIGYEYNAKIWSVRMGYRYTSFLYEEDLLSVGYPYVSKSHYTLGGSYALTPSLGVNVALLYAPYDRTLDDGYALESDYTTLSVGLDYSF